ncbi:aspartate/glutamate racemase family protein [Nocardioides nanhaiensis]|uniref:Arylsulfatase n=1 Tax=Nocardioides nanhaiensis TaxID=1476871 RepID=A0ABP8VT42_9ACTN
MAAATSDLTGGSGPVLGLLHTAEEHCATFAALVREVAPGLPDLHVVEPGLLARARRDGLDAVRDGLLRRLRDLDAAGADHVLVTCSTLGGLAEALAEEAGVPVLRVDRPMAQEAARRAATQGRPVLVVAALAATLGPTERLLRSVSSAPLVVVHELVDDAWPLFESGDRSGYLATVAAATRGAVERHDPAVVVLAQASAAGAADLLTDLGCPVLSSPVRAVRQLARVLGVGPAR